MGKNNFEMEVVTPLVLEIQGGNQDKWLDLIEALADHKRVTLKMYGKKLGKYATDDDIAATYDDVLMTAVANFDQEKSTNFVKYLYGLLQVSIPHLKRSSMRLVRKANTFAEYGDSVIENGHGEEGNMTLFELMTDEQDAYSDLDATSSIFYCLKSYSDQNEASKLNADLIVAAAIDEAGSEERKQKMLSVLPAGTTWASARKKLQRARDSFKLYLQENY